MSKRLWEALHALRRKRFNPGPEELVWPDLNQANFRHRAWRRICERAGIGVRRPKDLRDTFASQLLTAGVQLGYVSRALGHAGVAVTSAHYARRCGEDDYRPPVVLVDDEVPADLLARVGRQTQQPRLSVVQ